MTVVMLFVLDLLRLGTPMLELNTLLSHSIFSIGAFALPCMIIAAVVLRRKSLLSRVSAGSLSLAPSSAAFGSQADTFPLELVNIEKQTHDTKTLFFRLPDGIRLHAKPGQFLTLHLNIDGNEVARSYTICSSPLKTRAIEITPKRTKNGYVSTFLNERAVPGLIIEARGPSGQFYFDEKRHSEIVLIAGGSGITPMMAILRYFKDRSLSAPVTLIYSVRTSQDIIFERELTRLSRSLPHFRYVVTVTAPDIPWKGNRGRLTKALLEEHVADFRIPTFFLCGPSLFMQLARELLKEQGVAADRIKEESFGGKPPSANPGEERIAPTGTVEFRRSGMSCALAADMTILELAERAGVSIPFGCRQGQCGTCATHLLSGNVVMDAQDGLSIEQKQAGFILPCVSRANHSISIDV